MALLDDRYLQYPKTQEGMANREETGGGSAAPSNIQQNQPLLSKRKDGRKKRLSLEQTLPNTTKKLQDQRPCVKLLRAVLDDTTIKSDAGVWPFPR